MSKRKTIEQFIKEARKVHGDKYDYSKVDMNNRDEKGRVCIICPIHGEFWQTPLNHLNGHKCPKCANKHKYTTEEWVEKAREVHGDDYDYSESEYINNHTKICIICPKHGEFWIRPSDHINGIGCKKCSNEIKSQKFTSTKESFIEKAKKIHGDRYIYSYVEYVDAHVKVKLLCPIHGEFWIRPNSHLNGQGCPKCNQSHLEKEIANFLIVNNIAFEQSKHFKWLRLQHLDFYLPKYNIAIECQGKQHYKPTRFGSKKDEKILQENFNIQQKRDLKKKQLCEENGIKLLYFTHYKDIEENEITFKDKEKILEYILNEKTS